MYQIFCITVLGLVPQHCHNFTFNVVFKLLPLVASVKITVLNLNLSSYVECTYSTNKWELTIYSTVDSPKVRITLAQTFQFSEHSNSEKTLSQNWKIGTFFRVKKKKSGILPYHRIPYCFHVGIHTTAEKYTNYLYCIPYKM